ANRRPCSRPMPRARHQSAPVRPPSADHLTGLPANPLPPCWPVRRGSSLLLLAPREELGPPAPSDPCAKDVFGQCTHADAGLLSNRVVTNSKMIGSLLSVEAVDLAQPHNLTDARCKRGQPLFYAAQRFARIQMPFLVESA